MAATSSADNKYASIRKSLIKEAIIAGVIVVAVGVLASVIGGWSESSQAAKIQAQSALSVTQSEVDVNKLTLGSFDKNLETYEALDAVRDNENYDLSRSALQEQLARLRQKYRLSELNLQLESQTKIESDIFKNNEAEVYSAAGKLTFAGITDQHLYSFIQELQRVAPAFITIKQLTLKRNLSFDLTIMRKISQGETVSMVSGELAFDWIGFSTDTVKKKDKVAP